MTVAEKQQHLGLNISLSGPIPEEELFLSSVPAASAKDWRNEGKVAAVKHQGECGSCWAFSAVGAVETNYAIKTGKMKQFAEQEYLDCTYSSKDGCKGGWFHDAWSYSAKAGRLATLAAAPYKAKDGACSYDKVHNGLVAAKIGSSRFISEGESNVISALNSGAVSVAYEATEDFFHYKDNIIRDNTCKMSANHAVTAVGYTRDAMIVKNSWGATWGRGGYFYTGRGHHGCQIYKHGMVPTLKSTGKTDTDADYVSFEE